MKVHVVVKQPGDDLRTFLRSLSTAACPNPRIVDGSISWGGVFNARYKGSPESSQPEARQRTKCPLVVTNAERLQPLTVKDLKTVAKSRTAVLVTDDAEAAQRLRQYALMPSSRTGR